MAANAPNPPIRLAAHGDIVRNPSLFWDTYTMFHSNLGSLTRVSKVAREEVNLHLLYVVVTKSGGYDKVVSENKWDEVIRAGFKFSRRATEELKDIYFNLLYTYEQAHFIADLQPLVQSGRQMELRVVGTFEGGYFVAYKVGSTELRGAMFNCPPPPPPPPQDPPNIVTTALPPPPDQAQDLDEGPLRFLDEVPQRRRNDRQRKHFGISGPKRNGHKRIIAPSMPPDRLRRLSIHRE